MPSDAQQKEMDKWMAKGHDVWITDCVVYHAPKVDYVKFGEHKYRGGGMDGLGDCEYGCGCWMGTYSSSGPVNPFGACPNNPVEKEGKDA